MNDFIYEDKQLGHLYMRESGTNNVTVHRLSHDKKPLCTLEAFWWDLSTINKLMDEKREEIKKAILGDCITDSLNALHKIVEEVAPSLPKYNSARTKVLAEELIKEIELGVAEKEKK